MGRLDGKRILITGAASGIGRAAARLFAAEGARWTLCDVKAAEGEAVATELQAAGHQVVFVQTDVGDPQQMEAAVAHGVSAY